MIPVPRGNGVKLDEMRRNVNSVSLCELGSRPAVSRIAMLRSAQSPDAFAGPDGNRPSASEWTCSQHQHESSSVQTGVAAEDSHLSVVLHPGAGGNGNIRRLLLGEDNEMNRDMLSRRLTRRGYHVDTACDGQAGSANQSRGRPSPGLPLPERPPPEPRPRPPPIIPRSLKKNSTNSGGPDRIVSSTTSSPNAS
jgi:CheY-like chemotaxis protein